MRRNIWLCGLFLIILTAYTYLEAENDRIGQLFINQTRLGSSKKTAPAFSKGAPPPAYKTYSEAMKIKLPPPEYNGLRLEEAIRRRRSVRKYAKLPLTLAQLSQLLYAAQGITGQSHGLSMRSAPSAGALYPMEIYPVINNVSGLKQGIYHYAVKEHALEQLRTGDFSSQIASACLKQEAAGTAQVCIVLGCIFARLCYKYGERGYRYALIEAGHIGQNIYLQATSLGMGAVAMGAFYDDKLNELLGIDAEQETAIYVLAVGNKYNTPLEGKN
jgi:SagB-type dehydrogenase family enzyme